MATTVSETADTTCQESGNHVHQAQQLLEMVRRYRSAAEQQAGEAAAEARHAAKAELQQTTSAAVLEQIILQIGDAKADWQRHWEQAVVQLATAIAQRVIRSELSRRPELLLAIVKEALQLAAGADDITLRVNPADHELLHGELERLAATLCQLAPTDIVADAGISPGGCLVETRFGQVDLQIESQLRQIEQELLHS